MLTNCLLVCILALQLITLSFLVGAAYHFQTEYIRPLRETVSTARDLSTVATGAASVPLKAVQWAANTEVGESVLSRARSLLHDAADAIRADEKKKEL
jgi:hypothetical protein